MPGGARVLVCAGLLLVAAAPVRALAAQPAVAVNVDPCVPVDHVKLNELLAIELGASTVRGPWPAALTQVYVDCLAQGIELRLDDGVTRKSMARVLPASSFADASSTRLLALAVAEFVVASWIELRAQPKAAVEPIGPAPPEAARNLAAQVVSDRTEPIELPLPQSSLSLGMALQVWTSNDAILLGASLRLIVPIARMLAFTASGEVALAQPDVGLGTLSLTTSSLTVAIALHASIAEIDIFTGPAARVGIAFVDATPRDRESLYVEPFAAAYGGPAWLLRFELLAGSQLRVGLEVEAGLTTLPVRANFEDDVSVFDLDHAWLTSTLSAGFGF